MSTSPRDLLDVYAVGHEDGAIGCRGFNRRDHAPAAFAALRAVLDLHARDAFPARRPGAEIICSHCSSSIETDPVRYPCPTVRAVVTALGGAP